MLRAFSYLRFSHPDQAKGDSIRRQMAGTLAYCQRHGLTLDDSIDLRDEGISGYKGLHRENPDRHALALFLELVKQPDKIPPDSYLIIENLDRLSREHIRPALTLFLGLLDAGINIVQLHPETVFRHDSHDPFDIMRAILELSRGHGESEMKSVRVGAAWRNKKANASDEPLTAKVPGWLKLSQDRTEIVPIPSAVETVKLIYRLAIDGYGTGEIVKKLNREGIAPIGGTKRSDHWAKSSLMRILTSRAVLGEYQPHAGRAGARKPVGDPVSDYYPAIIDSATYYAAQSAIKSRQNQKGRSPTGLVTNLFTGLLHDARNGGTFVLKGEDATHERILVSYKATIGQDKQISFPYKVFEDAILTTLHEIDVNDLTLPTPSVDKVAILSAELDEVNATLKNLQAAIESGSNLATALAAATNLEARRTKLKEQIEEAEREASTREADSLREIQSLLGLKEPERIKLKSKIRKVIFEIWAVFFAEGSTRYAFLQLYFRRDGVRSIVIYHKPATGGMVGKHDAITKVVAATSDGPASGFDLRKGEIEGILDMIQTVFPSLTTIAERINALDISGKEKLRKWQEVTGRGTSEFYRKLRG